MLIIGVLGADEARSPEVLELDGIEKKSRGTGR
jgi:hypothetical protein